MKQYLWSATALFILSVLAGASVYVARQPAGILYGEAAVPVSALGTRYYAILRREAGAYGSLRQPANPDAAGYLGTGTSVDADVRLNSGAALAFAVLASHTGRSPSGVRSPASSAVSPRGSSSNPDADRAIRILRYLVYTHRVGPGVATDAKKWGSSDGSAVDASNMGMAAYLVRPWIDSPTYSGVGSVVDFEAERYLLSSPSTESARDSAALSNVAAGSILCVAGTLFSSGRTAYAFQRRALDYIRLVLTTNRDLGASQNGSRSPTLFPDLTLQCDGQFSTAAELQVLAALSRCALCYRLVSQQEPADLDLHVTDCWGRVLLKLGVAGGWFLTIDGGVTPATSAVSWLATAFSDPAAMAVDQESADRLVQDSGLNGEIEPTMLEEPRPADIAVRTLIYNYFSPAAGAIPLPRAMLDRSLAGVTWLPAASMAINRSETAAASYSWVSGAGEAWALANGEHIQWRFYPAASGSQTPGAVSESPAWTVGSDDFTTMGVLKLENGASVQAGVYSLSQGAVVLLEHAAVSPDDAGIALSKSSVSQEPDLFRDDEQKGKLDPSEPRWANIDNSLGIIVLQGTIRSVSPPGVGPADPTRSTWPIMSLGPGTDQTVMAVLYPGLTVRETRDLAASTAALRFAGPGWAGALIPSASDGDELVVGRFAGATDTLVSLSSGYGAPVTVEEGVLTGTVTTVALSSPSGAAHSERITCWLNVGGGVSVTARQGPDAGACTITNSAQQSTTVTARYISTGVPCQITGEDGRTLVRLPAREDLGEVHFNLSPGRAVTMRY